MWVSRDKDGRLFFSNTKPVKHEQTGVWFSTECNQFFEIDENLFPEVKWSNFEPTEVKLVKKEK